jgi:hypothetical protein
MTTRYISPSGSDSNNGLGPDASNATNKPYLTLGKAMNTGSPVVPGDIVYIAPGYYYSTAAVPISGITSAASPTQFIGDPKNRQGFKDGSGVLLPEGQPWITTRTAVEGLNSSIAATGNLIDGSTNNPSGLQFRNLVLECQMAGAGAAIYRMSAAAGTDIVFEDCFLTGGYVLRLLAATAPTAGRNHIIRRCTCVCIQLLQSLTTVAAATANADLNILFEENFMIGNVCGALSPLQIGAAAANLAGGIRAYHNTAFCSTFFQTVASVVSTVTPCRVAGNILFNPTIGSMLNAGTSGQIVDDGYNMIYQSTTAFTNVTKAGTTTLQPAPNLILPHLIKWGLQLPREDFGGWSEAADTAQRFSALGRTTADHRGHLVRPWGAGDSVGCWQSLNMVKDTSGVITGGGTNAPKMTGAGDLTLYVPVAAVATTLTVKTESASYGGTSYPQLVLDANEPLGVSAATATATDATEQTLTIGPFTPTAAGVVEVHLRSRSTSGTSFTYFDTLTRT